jgi:hypothetical protein
MDVRRELEALERRRPAGQDPSWRDGVAQVRALCETWLLR